MFKLKELKPERVFYHFEEITKIPRCSYEEIKISNYLKSLGERLNLDTIQDEYMNIIIRKPASKGYEDSEGVIIQGHMDMVCEKDNSSKHNFQKDPLDLIVEEDFIKANKTTLGADNGIAVAMGLAILEDDSLEHPSLELLVTTSEETGMDGAIGLSDKILKGSRLLNLDSDEEGILTVGSAGGALVDIRIPAEFESNKESIDFSIEIKGLLGGHSGVEIDKDRLNANKILANILIELKNNVLFSLISFKGGSKDNAIPRESRAEISVSIKEQEKFRNKLIEIKDKAINDYKDLEANMNITLEEISKNKTVLSEKTTKILLNILEEIPTGVNTRMKENNSIVESSSNLSIVNLDKERFVIQTSLRSSNPKELLKLEKKITDIAIKYKGQFDIRNRYPEWEYKIESKLRDIAVQVFFDMTGRDIKTDIIHAGLETGVFAKKYPNIDIISFGPNMEYIHTPQERLSISSTKRTYEYLIELLKALK